MKQKTKVYTISEVTREIKQILEGSFNELWVVGEISNFTLASSGHMYFTLKDKLAQLPVVFFRQDNINVKFELQDGLEVVCFGRIGVYEKRGAYQLYVQEIEPKGIGALQLAFEQLKQKLAKEGLFDHRFKKPIPIFPHRVGVITSLQGAAIRDILKVFKNKFLDLELTINPVRVQGKGAASEIARALDEFNNLRFLNLFPLDVIILGRGGGNLEDLWAFNEEIVARAIFKSKVPVISAVGHEIDFTISDMVSDLRASTPSAAAHLVISRKEEILKQLQDSIARIQSAITNILDLAESRFKPLSQSYILKDPLNLIRQHKQRIDELIRNVSLSITHKLNIQQESFRALAGKLHTLSPLNILQRGYSISWKLPQEALIKDVKILRLGCKVKTRVAKGEFISQVKEIKNAGR